MRYGAYGLVEVLGAANAVRVTDQMLKIAEVTYQTKDTKCGGHALVFITGSIAAVTAAIDNVRENPPCDICNCAVVPNPSEEMIHIVEGFKKRG